MFMLWMLAELFEVLPEADDAAKPGLVFFFDEAHVLFKDSQKHWWPNRTNREVDSFRVWASALSHNRPIYRIRYWRSL